MKPTVGLIFLLAYIATSRGDICSTCDCINANPYYVDCNKKELESMVENSEWPQEDKIEDMEASFDYNSITEITTFPPLPLTRLSFCHNKISKIAIEAFKNLTKLTFLDLSHNELTSESLRPNIFDGKFSPNYFEPLNIKWLNLSYNSIHSLDRMLFEHLPFIEKLALNNNPLKVFTFDTEGAITMLNNLKELDLSETQLQSLPQGLLHSLNNLEVLTIAGNKFKDVPSELNFATNLRSLNLNNNPIVEILDFEFQGMPNLKELSISSMPELVKIGPAAFGALHKLTKLICSFNPKLNEISETAFMGIVKKESEWPVKELYLSFNDLKTIPHKMAAWDKIDIIDIQGNPWQCDCNLDWVATNLVSRIADKTPDLTLTLVCANPPKLRGRSLVVLGRNPDAFKCNGGPLTSGYWIGEGGDVAAIHMEGSLSTTALAITLMGVLILVLGAVGLGVLYLRRRAVRNAFLARQQIRYTRASTDEGTEEKRVPVPEDEVVRNETA